MKLSTLQKLGYTLLRTRPYRVQNGPAQYINLANLAQPEGKEYYELIHSNGNILLVLKENMEL